MKLLVRHALFVATRFALATASLAGLPSCALLTKADPVVPRYFSPESSEPAPARAPPPPSAASLRLGRIGGSSYLKERIVFRSSAHELAFYEDRRWTERPEVYLQRGLERLFFETRGVRRALTDRAPTLTADLVELEEVRGATPSVHLRISYALHDEQTVYDEGSIAVDHPLAAGDEKTQPERAAAAFGVALHQAVTELGDRVLGDLASVPRAAP
jgi:cholesterol transport system auxiliary component